MKVVIVNCFDTYEERIDLLYEYFVDKGNDVTVIESDFRHFKKVKRTDSKKDFIFVESDPYYKNMSISRLISHYKFAKKAFELVEDLKPELLYVTLPPNSLAKFAAKYKRQYRNVKLYFDIIDLWPETMPIGKIKSLPPFTYWRYLRDNNLKYADNIITECNLYQTVLKNVITNIKSETLYLAKRGAKIKIQPNLDKNTVNLCYLGSINNIIDIPRITKLVKVLNEKKQVILHIIGDGENKDSLIEEVKKTGATVEYYGKVYDPIEKQKIFDKCQFGINIMKDTVCVGLTMKSIDYFQAGLPILNTIPADTAHLVEKYKIGININEDNMGEIVNRIISFKIAELLDMRENTQNVFEKYFSFEAFREKLDNVINECN